MPLNCNLFHTFLVHKYLTNKMYCDMFSLEKSPERTLVMGTLLYCAILKLNPLVVLWGAMRILDKNTALSEAARGSVLSGPEVLTLLTTTLLTFGAIGIGAFLPVVNILQTGIRRYRLGQHAHQVEKQQFWGNVMLLLTFLMHWIVF